MNLFETINHNKNIYSVSEISQELQENIENKFSEIFIRGEISSCKTAASGHVYFCLKDNKSLIDAICWKYNLQNLSIKIEDGLEVVCRGKITTYAQRSKYQIIVDSIEIAGKGALMALFEKRKKQFISEGLFAAEHKKPLPKYPQTIAVITSETGAVIKDIIHRIENRFPLRILIKPVLVQGENAAQQIANAINLLNNNNDKLHIDLIIIARGGGSIEDLWAFNEEIVVREAFGSKLPIISAIGHETDYTLLDYVADMRAPTPTAAAEIAVPDKADLEIHINNLQMHLIARIERIIKEQEICLSLAKNIFDHFISKIENMNQQVDELSYKLHINLNSYINRFNTNLQILSKKLRTPEKLIFAKRLALQKLDNQLVVNIDKIIRYDENELKIENLKQRLLKAISDYINNLNLSIENKMKLLNSYSYKNILQRGFTIIKDKNGNIIKSKKDAENIESIEVIWYDGSITYQDENF